MRTRAVQEAAAPKPVMIPDIEIDRLYTDYHEVILQSAYRITGSAADAEDVLQTVFLRLVKRRHRPSLEPPAAVAYFRRAAVNAALDLIRGRKKRKDVPLMAVEGTLPGDASAGPDQCCAAAELQERLRTALAELSPSAAEVFILRCIEGHDNRKTAEMLETTPGTVAVTLHRARAQLKETLRDHFGGPSHVR